MMYLIKYNAPAEEVAVTNDFGVLHDYVDGFVEMLGLGDGHCLLVDEDARCKNGFRDKLNKTASELYGGYPIFGNVILCKVNKDGNFGSVDKRKYAISDGVVRKVGKAK